MPQEEEEEVNNKNTNAEKDEIIFNLVSENDNLKKHKEE